MGRTSKYKYLKVIQAKIEGRWVDYTAYDRNNSCEMASLRADLKTYCENEPYRFRVVCRRLAAGDLFHA